jgi:hypothetical protein
MDKFLKFDQVYLWRHNNGIVLIDSPFIKFDIFSGLGEWNPSTREEFTAAALQAIEKLKAQGIDIGTDWLPKWEPKVGEVVCAWDNRNGEGFIVAKFVSQGDGVFPYKLSNHSAYQHIAPFTGEIPEPFKSRWEAEGNANQ